MENQFQREELLIGKDGLEKIQKSKVIVYGIGGVGSYIVEGLVRAGVGHIVLVDFDTIDITNINRQIHALHSSVGKKKIIAMKERVLDINPNIKIEVYDSREDSSFEEESLIDNTFSYVIDAVDTLSSKIKIIEKAKKENVPIISAMGVGNRLDCFKLEIADISKTSMCPLAKRVRKELKNKGIKKVKVLYSKEETIKHENKNIIGSISYMPSIAGLMIAGEVIRDLIQ